MPGRLKALSVRQPWADLILTGDKDVENRTWKLPDSMIGKRIIIHAGIKTDGDYGGDKSRLGALLGEVTITGCVTASSSEWFDGPYGFGLECPVSYDKPIPCKGRLGFFYPEIL